MKIFLIPGLLLLLGVGLGPTISAQTKKSRKRAKEHPVPAAPAPSIEKPPVAVTPSTEVLAKVNVRPVVSPTREKKNGRDVPRDERAIPVFFYEFSRPGFVYSRIFLEHDETGKGKISFARGDSDELITDPVSLSSATVAKLTEAFTALNFLESDENYQHARDYSHMGNTGITVRKEGRTRSVKFNWTDNKHAKILMDEYRRISNEYTWRFEISVARENQRLETPKLMDTLDSYLKRGEISDPVSLIPFLSELTTDERLPLIARNHAAKLIKQIERTRK